MASRSSRIEEDGNVLRLDLPAAHSAGRMAREVVRRFALVRGVEQDEISNLELITSELLGNAVDHGGGNAAMEESDLSRVVRMSLVLTLDPSGWCLRVSDQGGGDPAELEALIHPVDDIPDLEDERGRGFFLLAQMVDELLVAVSEDGRGLAFTAVRRFPGAGSRPDSRPDPPSGPPPGPPEAPRGGATSF